MGLSYHIAPPDGLDEGQLASLARDGVACGADDGAMSFYSGYSDVMDAIIESQRDPCRDSGRTEVDRDAIAWAGPTLGRLEGIDVVACAELMGDEQGGEAVADWLNGVTLRRTTCATVPIASLVDLPELRCVLDRDAQYLHSQTLGERLRGDGDDGLTIDVRPTVTAGAGTARVRHVTAEVTQETEERDPVASRTARHAFETAIGTGDDMPYGVRTAIRDLVRDEPASAMGLLRRLDGIHRALARADVASFVIERSF